jgi:PAS domain S-box-containing protein
VITTGTRFARIYVAAAGSLLGALVLLSILRPLQPALLSGGGWTLTSLIRVGGVLAAWRASQDERRRRAWGWLAVASLIDLAAQLYWDVAKLNGAPPLTLSLADIGFLAVYPMLFLAAWNFLAEQPRFHFSAEIVLDATLLTLTAVAWAYELGIEPVALEATGTALIGSIAYTTGGLALIWLIGLLLLRPNRFPSGGEGIAVIGLVVYALSDLLFGTVVLPRSTPAPQGLDLGWAIANTLLGMAGAVAAARPEIQPAARQAKGSVAPRLVAVLVGLAGLIALFVRRLTANQVGFEHVVLPIAGGIVIAARIVYSLFADRRYENALEREVERQTETLLTSLTAAASAERNLRQIVEASPDPIVLLNREGRVLEFSPDAPPLPGAQPIPGRSMYDAFEPDAATVVRQHLEAAFAGEVRRFEIPLRRADGSRGVSSLVYAPIRERGAITKVLAIARDVTELRRAQSQLQQADKLAAMGQLVSGVAHEINNPAAIISGFAQTLMLDDLRPEQREIVEMVRDEAMRIGQITTNLLAFARMSGPERSLVDVNELVRRTHTLRAYHLNTLNVSVQLDLDPQDPRVWANVSELQQMLLNLLINAEQALESYDGARGITLRTKADHAEVRIECRDSGPGIPAEIRTRIFDPFFTTKPEGVGTGLGLSICYGIVKGHGGRIWAESDAGNGASFVVALPLDLRTLPRPAVGIAPELPAGAETLNVLVVDDEPGIRQATARFLNRSGMQVRAVSDGAEALRALRTQDFDVILCDVRMPGMNGRDFLIRLREQAPRLVSTLIFATGDSFDTDTAALLADAGAPSLVKPFDFDALERLVRDVAARAARRATEES